MDCGRSAAPSGRAVDRRCHSRSTEARHTVIRPECTSPNPVRPALLVAYAPVERAASMTDRLGVRRPMDSQPTAGARLALSEGARRADRVAREKKGVAANG